jgi:hypothetical protein
MAGICQGRALAAVMAITKWSIPHFLERASIGHRLMKQRTGAPASSHRAFQQTLRLRWQHSPRTGGVNERKPRTCRGFKEPMEETP